HSARISSVCSRMNRGRRCIRPVEGDLHQGDSTINAPFMPRMPPAPGIGARVCSRRPGLVVFPHMNPVVHKFGGAALADAAAIRHAVDIVARQRQGTRGVTVVVSAMGGVTDTLL